jgi:acyl carrier protein
MRLEDVLSSILGDPPEAFTDDYSQQTSSNWTSMHHVELVIALEEAFDVQFSNAEMTNMRSVRDIRAALERDGATVA